MTDQHSTAPPRDDYYDRRARQERGAAEQAVNETARQIHLVLAERYDELARDL